MSVTWSTCMVRRGDWAHATASAKESEALGSGDAERRNAVAEINGRWWCEVIRRTSANGGKRWCQ
ncbi:hypothetical protein E2562_023973 [Oryza meyeriana var. granulata]|uniref:Uncharacterized protein n=1 Tax=Oryza meyeriana var. granulata TaxID=110450 RepID=A0A6G1BZK2_9ORYZ|nr:hypothetical protein E2562_023973 [Oryza meyeriana var. granulata]